MWAVYLTNRGYRFNCGVYRVGIAATGCICLGSIGLVAINLLAWPPAVYGAGFLGVQFLGWLLLGCWLLGVGALGLRSATVGPYTSWAAIVAGVGAAGGMVTLVFSYAVGSFTPAFPLFMTLYAIGFVLWAFWLGGELRAREVESPAHTVTDTEASS